MKHLLLKLIFVGGVATIGLYVVQNSNVVKQSSTVSNIVPMVAAALKATPNLLTDTLQPTTASISYPKGSIGELAKEMQDLLSQPDSRRITQVPSKPYVSPGLVIQGPNFTSFDTYSVEVNDDGATLHYKDSTWDQVSGQAATGRVYVELPKLDPANFTSITYQYWPSLTEGLPASHLVVVESSDKLIGSVFRPNAQPATLPRFGFGFVHEADARKLIKLLETTRDRAQFEAHVQDALPHEETFVDRSVLYGDIYKKLLDQETKTGFFGAASSVTASLSAPPWLDPMSPETQEFMQDLSRGLAELNAPKALEELRFGHLTTPNGAIDSPDAMDRAMVNAEQEYAESKLQALPSEERDRFVADVNKSMSGYFAGFNQLDEASILFKAILAAKEVRDQKRADTANPNAELDYGSLDERVKIGLAAARKFREGQ